MSLKSRLDRLERRTGAHGGLCPDCPPLTLLFPNDDGTFRDEAGNVVPGGGPPPCRTCGGPHDIRGIRFISVGAAPSATEGESPEAAP